MLVPHEPSYVVWSLTNALGMVPIPGHWGGDTDSTGSTRPKRAGSEISTNRLLDSMPTGAELRVIDLRERGQHTSRAAHSGFDQSLEGSNTSGRLAGAVTAITLRSSCNRQGLVWLSARSESLYAQLPSISSGITLTILCFPTLPPFY